MTERSEQTEASELYSTASIESAPPIVIVRRLYEGALRFLERAAGADPSSRAFTDSVLRAEAIVVELRLALEERHAPEIARALADLYEFIESCLRCALRERDAAPIGAARAVLERLAKAWASVEPAPLRPGAAA